MASQSVQKPSFFFYFLNLAMRSAWRTDTATCVPPSPSIAFS